MVTIPATGRLELRRFGIRAAATALLGVALMLLGSTVRVTGSGLACPDWPLCHGMLVPPWTFQVFMEWFHRLIAAIFTLTFALLLSSIRHSIVRHFFGLPLIVTGIVLCGQITFGALTVLQLLEPTIVSVHLLGATVIVTMLALMAQSAWRLSQDRAVLLPVVGGGGASGEGRMWTRRAILALAGLVGLQVVLGSVVSSTGAGQACIGFPTCNGLWIDASSPWVLNHVYHRWVGILLSCAIPITWWLVRRRDRASGAVVRHLGLASVLVGVQVALGLVNVLGQLPRWAIVAHTGGAVMLFALLVWAYFASNVSPRIFWTWPEGLGQIGARVQLTKPLICLLVAITGVPSLFMVPQSLPPVQTALAALIGLFLTAAAASVFNQLADARLDATMERTRGRPLPLGRLRPWVAARFGVLLGITGLTLLWTATTPLAALVALAAMGFYALFYTLILKRRTPLNIVIGGAAGAVGPLVVWAAVRGDLSWAPWILFAVIFLWTPPHFWALCLNYAQDYRQAGIPMLPVARGDEVTRRQMLLYSIALLPVTLALYPIGAAGIFYLAVATLAGLGFIGIAWLVWSSGNNQRSMLMFHYSCIYMVLIFGGLTIDRTIAILWTGT